MKTKAIVFAAKNKVEIRDVNIGEMNDNEVMIDVEYSFISPGTERWILTKQFDDGFYNVGYKFPIVPGYQHAGKIIAVGKNITDFKIGDRVFGTSNKYEGIVGMWGGHCAKSINNTGAVHHLPDNVSTRDASALVIAQVGFNGGSRPPVNPGDVALVLGDGMIGQFAARTLYNRGAYVIVAGKGDKERLEYARKNVCDMTIDLADVDLETEVKRVAPNGVNIVVEAIGLQDYTLNVLDLLVDQGHFVLNGFYPGGNKVELNAMCLREITVHNPSGIRAWRMKKTLDLMSKGKINVGSMITHEFKSKDAAKAYEDLVLNRKKCSMGIAIDWSDVK